MKYVRQTFMIGALALSYCCRMSRCRQVNVPTSQRTIVLKVVNYFISILNMKLIDFPKISKLKNDWDVKGVLGRPRSIAETPFQTPNVYLCKNISIGPNMVLSHLFSLLVST